MLNQKNCKNKKILIFCIFVKQSWFLSTLLKRCISKTPVLVWTVDNFVCFVKSLILTSRISLLHHYAKSTEQLDSNALFCTDFASIFLTISILIENAPEAQLCRWLSPHQFYMCMHLWINSETMMKLIINGDETLQLIIPFMWPTYNAVRLTFADCVTCCVYFQHHVHRNKKRLWCDNHALTKARDNMEIFPCVFRYWYLELHWCINVVMYHIGKTPPIYIENIFS